MRARVDNHRPLCRGLARHGLTRLRRAGVAKTVLAGVLLLLATLAPFSESWHEASVRHVRCAEHGELTHVVVSGAADAHRAGAAHPSLDRGDAGTPAGHEHCDFTFVVQGSAHTPAIRTTVRTLPPSVVATAPALALPAPGRAFLLASAPKTSPPVA
jgi:hypothetical protein